MNIPQLIIDENLTLEPIKEKHSDEIYYAIDSNRKHLRTWLPFVDFTLKARHTLDFIKSVLDDPKESQIVFIIKQKDEFIGLIGLKDIDYLNKKVEIGYWLVENAVGKGIMSRSTKKVINFCFKNLEMHRVQIKCGIKNYKSIAIPERLEFTFEGIERCGEFHFSHYIDLNVYSLLKHEWKEKEKIFII